jgi:hypothetical protein
MLLIVLVPSRITQIPPDLVVKPQDVDLVDVILRLVLRPPLCINGKSRAELPSLSKIICLPLNQMECEISWVMVACGEAGTVAV